MPNNINSVTKRLADGTRRHLLVCVEGRTRRCAVNRGSPEFVASYNEAVSQKVEAACAVSCSAVHSGVSGQRGFPSACGSAHAVATSRI